MSRFYCKECAPIIAEAKADGMFDDDDSERELYLCLKCINRRRRLFRARRIRVLDRQQKDLIAGISLPRGHGMRAELEAVQRELARLTKVGHP